MTDEAGAVQEQYLYDPFGQAFIFAPDGVTQRNVSSTDQAYGFTSQRFDYETGLWYFKHRYLDDGLGRFISRDPAGYVDGMNLYTAYFVLTGTDPLGLAKDKEPRHHHHLAAKKVFDPADKESYLNKKGMKLADDVDIHSKDYGWDISAERHRNAHIPKRGGSDASKWNNKQKAWIDKMKKAGHTTITKDMLDGHVADMKKDYGLVNGNGTARIGRQAQSDWKGKSNYYSKLKKKGDLDTDYVDRMKKVRAKPKAGWFKRGVRAVPIAGGLFTAGTSYAGGDGLGTAAAKGVMEEANPIPVDVETIGDYVRSGAEAGAQRGRDQRERVEERQREQLMGAGMSQEELDGLMGE